MCYSETPERSAGYMHEHGYVLIGYKLVLNVMGVLYSPWCFEGMLDGVFFHDHEVMEMEREYRNRTNRPVHLYRKLLESLARVNERLQADTDGAWRFPSYPLGQLLRLRHQDHGFHVAATEESALSICHLGIRMITLPGPMRPVKAFDPQPVDYEVKTKRIAHPPYEVVRVLIPEKAVTTDGHCRALMVIPPGQKETPEQIATCDAWNQKPVTPRPDEPAPVYAGEMA